jgi:hypothetical protein
MGFLVSIFFGISLLSLSSSKIDTTLKTKYNFSVIIPERWKLFTPTEIDRFKKENGSAELLITAIGYLGDKSKFENIPHFYVEFYKQDAFNRIGFSNSVNRLLSTYMEKFWLQEMNGKYPDFLFKFNDGRSFVDSAKNMLLFSTSTKYSSNDIRILLHCWFLMKTGAAKIIFSFKADEIEKYHIEIEKILNRVYIDEEYKLKTN